MISDKSELENLGQVTGRVDSLEGMVEHIHEHGCAKIAEREGKVGELVGELKFLKTQVSDISVRLLGIEKALNQIIGNRDANINSIGYIVTIISVIISIVIGFLFKKIGL